MLRKFHLYNTNQRCQASFFSRRLIVAIAGILSSLAAVYWIRPQLNWLMGARLSTTTTTTKSMSTARRPDTYTIDSTGNHTGTVIFLHGLGDTGLGWSEALKDIREPHIKYICPTAVPIPVTLNGGMRMPSWFDLYALQVGGREDNVGIKRIVKDIVSEMVAEEEKAGIPSERVVIGGFSQGGALALYSALTMKKPLGGVMSLSGWLPLAGEFPTIASANRDIPVLLCHGDSDPLVAPQIGQLTRTKLSEFVSNISVKVYRGLGHSSSEEEMADVKAFIAKCLPNKSS